jgi:glycosyltransferase involved in cell wall biosynthesis
LDLDVMGGAGLYYSACCITIIHSGRQSSSILDSATVVCLVAFTSGYGPYTQCPTALGGWSVTLFTGCAVCLVVFRRSQLCLGALSVLPLGVALAMKVLIALNSAWNLVNFRTGLIKALVADGHTVVLAAPADDHVPALEALGTNFVHLPINPHSTNPVADLALLLRFVFMLRRERPALLMVFTAKPNVYGSLAAHALGIPVVNNIAGLGSVFIKGGWLAHLLTSLYRLALTKAQRVFFQNPDDYRQFVEMGLVRAEQCTVLPGSGVDLRRFQPVPLPSLQRANERKGQDSNDRRFVFLMVARLLKDKGVQEFVAAARLLKSSYPCAEFALLGFKDPKNPNAVAEEQLAHWQAKGWVTYWGSSADVREHLVLADCVVLPSYREGTPRSLLEAAAMGRPLVATDVPGCRELVRHGFNGLLCRPRDAQDLADQMRVILQMPDVQLAQMGQASLQFVEERFDEQRVIDAYLRTLDELC